MILFIPIILILGAFLYMELLAREDVRESEEVEEEKDREPSDVFPCETDLSHMNGRKE